MKNRFTGDKVTEKFLNGQKFWRLIVNRDAEASLLDGGKDSIINLRSGPFLHKPFLDGLEDDEEGRDDKEEGDGTDEHAANGAYSE